MSLNYNLDPMNIVKRLEIAHNPKQSIIRGKFFEKEHAFFNKYIKGKKVLVAGSGLGHDSFILARNNEEVIGIEILEPLVKIANFNLKKNKIDNLCFMVGDISNLDYSDEEFDVAILNMGTIGNFENKGKILRELLRVARKVYFDFYPPSRNNLEIRRKMYSEELWKNVRISKNRIISDDGLESTSLSKEEVNKIIRDIGAKVKYHLLNEFSLMAEIEKDNA